MVQLPEPCNEASEAHKGRYNNIADIAKDRIRLAGEKIREETERILITALEYIR